MQEIVNIRIDERLVHGQVATIWLKKLEVGRCVVIDDKAANNPLEKSMLRVATPDTIRLSVLGVEAATTNLLADKYDGQKLMIVVRSVQTLVAMYELGFRFDNVTVGNISGEQKVKRGVYLDKEDVDDFRFLAGNGVAFNAKMVYDDDDFNFMKALDGLKF